MKPFRWFAWRPVWTRDRGWVWLRPVWRRHVPPRDIPGVPTCWTWEHHVAGPDEASRIEVIQNEDADEPSDFENERWRRYD